jgi:IclR family acetate operon transcriptional repressor
VAKALELLDVLGQVREPLPLNQLAARVKLTKPSTFRLLFTLEATGYVLKDAEGRYKLRHDVRHGIREKLIAAVVEAGLPHMRDLTRQFRETTGLAVLFENHIEVVAVVESPHTVRMGNTVGRILQPHASSLGKCITAFQPDERREHLLRSYGVSAMTEHTLTDENALHRELERIRTRGYATDAQETCLEGFCFGAPIAGPDGSVFAAISMSVPRVRLGPPEHQKAIVERVKGVAGAITAMLGSPAPRRR